MALVNCNPNEALYIVNCSKPEVPTRATNVFYKYFVLKNMNSWSTCLWMLLHWPWWLESTPSSSVGSGHGWVCRHPTGFSHAGTVGLDILWGQGVDHFRCDHLWVQPDSYKHEPVSAPFKSNVVFSQCEHGNASLTFWDRSFYQSCLLLIAAAVHGPGWKEEHYKTALSKYKLF